MAKELVKTSDYKQLVKKIQAELYELDLLIKKNTVETYWRIGKYIHEHILKYKDRADYGEIVFKSLEQDIGRNESTLRKVLRFYRSYQIRVPAPELPWTYYERLLAVQDPQKRKEIEQKVIQKEWNTRDLRAYLSRQNTIRLAKRASQKPITQLAFTRGILWRRSLVENPEDENELLLDMGFTLRKEFQAPGLKLTKDDFLDIDPEDNSLTKAASSKDEIFTYKAIIVSVLDGDTIKAFIDLGLGMFIQQKLRFRGIDCPEIDTPDGLKAKKFVQSRLNPCDFIIIKTYKDSSDKYDRYLADIFYLADENDPFKVAQEGIFLNQELLDLGLAEEWK